MTYHLYKDGQIYWENLPIFIFVLGVWLYPFLLSFPLLKLASRLKKYDRRIWREFGYPSWWNFCGNWILGIHVLKKRYLKLRDPGLKKSFEALRKACIAYFYVLGLLIAFGILSNFKSG